jgi:hypothetical protein
MNPCRAFLVILISCIVVAAAAEMRAGSRGATGSTEGSFVGIEQGDYAHFVIKGPKGEADFIILRPDKSVQIYLDNPKKMKGRRVRVYWEEQNIPEAGEKMKTVTKVESRLK